jgi:hypothetical protein
LTIIRFYIGSISSSDGQIIPNHSEPLFYITYMREGIVRERRRKRKRGGAMISTGLENVDLVLSSV